MNSSLYALAELRTNASALTSLKVWTGRHFIARDSTAVSGASRDGTTACISTASTVVAVPPGFQSSQATATLSSRKGLSQATARYSMRDTPYVLVAKASSKQSGKRSTRV